MTWRDLRDALAELEDADPALSGEVVAFVEEDVSEDPAVPAVASIFSAGFHLERWTPGLVLGARLADISPWPAPDPSRNVEVLA